MALLGASVITLYDRVKAMDAEGRMAPVVELLMQKNPILNLIHFREGNLTQGHLYVSRVGLPSLTWRKFNEGIVPSKSRRTQHIETCGTLAGRSSIDVDLAELEDDAQAFRMDEDLANIAAMNNEVATGIFYHSSVLNPERFMGLSARYQVTAGNPASNQIIKHTGAPVGVDQNSIWFLWLGPNTIYGIYPKGSMGGISTRDMGERYVRDANNNEYLALVTEYKWKLGLVVQDFRQAARVCNIDTSALLPTNDDLIPAMIDAYSQIFDTAEGNGGVFCNRFIYKNLWKQARNKVVNSTLAVDKVEGVPVMSFEGTPIYKVDALGSAEQIVS